MIRNVCTQDQLETAFKAVNHGDVIAIQSKALPYMMKPKHAIAEDPTGGAVTINGKHDVQIVGLGNPVIQLTAMGTGLTITYCSDCTIEGITIKGTGPLRGEENEHSCAHIQLFGPNPRNTIKNCRFLDAPNHGIAHLWGDRHTTKCRFVNNYFSNGGNYARKNLKYDGAAIAVGGADITVEGNLIEDWLRGIEHENSLPVPSSSRTIIAGNRVLRCAWQSILVTPDSGKPNTPEFSELIVRDNIIVGTGTRVGDMSNTGIYVSGATNMMITGNQVRDIAAGCGILLDAQHSDIRDCLIAGNVVRDVDATGIQLSPGALGKCFDNVVRGNVLRRIKGRGVYVEGTGNHIEGNSVVDCDYEAYWSTTSDGVFGDTKNDWDGNRFNRCAKQSNV